jgi:hypothetical protein
VIHGIDPKGLETVEIDLLNIDRGRLHDDLVLIVVLKPIGILAIASIPGTPGRLNIGHLPRLRAEDPERGCRMKRSGANLEVIRLLNDAPLISPKQFQRKDQLLEIHSSSLADFFWSPNSKDL